MLLTVSVAGVFCAQFDDRFRILRCKNPLSALVALWILDSRFVLFAATIPLTPLIAPDIAVIVIVLPLAILRGSGTSK